MSPIPSEGVKYFTHAGKKYPYNIICEKDYVRFKKQPKTIYKTTLYIEITSASYYKETRPYKWKPTKVYIKQAINRELGYGNAE